MTSEGQWCCLGKRAVFFLVGLCALPWLVGLVGCGSKRPYLQEFSAAPYGSVCSVAVLPFGNKSGYRQANRIFYRIFSTEMIKFGGWHVALEGDVRQLYRQLHLKPWEAPNIEQIRVIASRLGVERVIAGDVLAMEEKVSKEFVNPSIEVQVRVYDGASGKLLLSTLHRREGKEYRTMMHFGLINTVTNLGRRVAQEILELWKKKGFSPCAVAS